MFATLLCNCFGSGRAKLHLQPPLSVLNVGSFPSSPYCLSVRYVNGECTLQIQIRCLHIVLFVMVNVSLVIVCRRCA